MNKTPVKRYRFQCSSCEYKWLGRKERPKECPRCKKRFERPSQGKPIEIVNEVPIVLGDKEKGLDQISKEEKSKNLYPRKYTLFNQNIFK